MARLSAALFAMTLAACGGEPAASDAALPRTGWSITPESDLNGFFDCLDEKGSALVAAHRGGPSAGFPENAIETFEATLAAAPALIEIDVAASADGVLFLMHDDVVDRATMGRGAVETMTFDEIRRLRLVDSQGAATGFHPPSFADALAWAKGRTILEIDFKRSARYEDVIGEINRQQAEDRVILIAYTTAQAARLHRLAPDMMISLNIASQSDLNRAVAAGVPADRLIGFTGLEAPNPRLYSLLEDQEIEIVLGALGGRNSIDSEIERSGDEARYAELAAFGVDIIATDRPGPAQAALNAAGRGARSGSCGVDRREN